MHNSQSVSPLELGLTLSSMLLQAILSSGDYELAMVRRLAKTVQANQVIMSRVSSRDVTK